MTSGAYVSPFSAEADRLRAGPGQAAGPFGFYLGWYNVLSGMVAIMLIAGTTAYSFGLFIKPVSEGLGISRATTNLGLILFHLGTAIYSPVVGRLLDRFPILTIYRVGAALFGLAWIGLSMTTTPIFLALLIVGPLALGAVSAGALFANVLVARWFTRLRGRAMTLVALGTSLGGLIVFPIVAYLLSLGGWRSALFFTGIGVWVILWGLSLIVRVDPPNISAPTQAAAEAAHADLERLTPGEILRMREFWFIAVSVSLLLGVDQSLLATITPYVSDKGFSLAQAAGIMSAITGSAILCKFFLAWIADRVDLRLLLAGTALCSILLCIVLLIAPGYPLLFAASCITGLAIGCTFPIGNAMMARRFGAGSVGSALGLMVPLLSASAMSLFYFTGLMHDLYGSYDAAFWGFISIAILSILLMPLIRLPSMRLARSDV